MQTLSRREFGLMAMAAGLAVSSQVLAQTPGGTEMAFDEGRFIQVNGKEHWITVRGRSRSNPVMLILHGGPGFPMSFMAPWFARWEEHFTLVQWDQPGGGATYSRNQERDTGPFTIARYVDDGLAVAEQVRAHLGTEKLVLLGNSWGTVLGVMMARRRPELFAAYVGTSQAVSGPQGARIGYDLALQAARERGDAAAVAALEGIGPPPYARFEDFMVRQQYTNPPGLPPSPREAAAGAAQGAALAVPPPPDARYIAPLPPYDFFSVFLDMQRRTFAETWAWEARDQGLDFGMPVFVIQGENDLNTPASLARVWLDEIRAPRKGFELIAGIGHNVLAVPDELLALLNRDVRPLAIPSAVPRG